MSVKRLKEVDAVVIGMGWTGAILARELTKAGLTVVGLERGRDQIPGEDMTLPSIRDELRYAVRNETMWDTSISTLTFRNDSSQTALPMRRLGAFLPGEGVGGSGMHWGGLHWRYLPTDFAMRSRVTERYGAGRIPDYMSLQDWPVSYAELEPYYTHFDKICAVSGQAGNLRGRTIAGGNPFEGPRSEEYPNKPLQTTLVQEMMRKAAGESGYHPFPMPISNASAPYVNPEGLTIGACQYCGFCNRLGCESNAKASPNICILPKLRADPRFTLRTHAFADRILYDKAAHKARGVTFTDMRSGQQYEQPAGIVILASYAFNNTHMMLLSGIGEAYDPVSGRGHVGRNYTYQAEAGAWAFFEGKEFNPYIAASGSQVVIDDFNGDNFDHAKHDFIGGGFIGASAGALPIASRRLPEGTPRWGSEWKAATARWYRSTMRFGIDGAGSPSRANYLDLDPTYKDALGRPLLRMTFNDTENDLRQIDFLTGIAEGLAKRMKPDHVLVHAKARKSSIVPYQSTHNAGGTIMGSSPGDSVVNRYLQSWDADNLFVMGASVFPHQGGYNPTGTVGALAYWSANAIVSSYLKAPGPLVHA
jgi:gluconate 2-dehydrogenase alpha chain